MKSNEDENKYKQLASFLDNRFDSSDESFFSSEEETRKLLFLWDECGSPAADTEAIWNKTLGKIKEEDVAKMNSLKKRLVRTGVLVAASVSLLLGMAFFFQQGNESVPDEKLRMEQLVQADAVGQDVKEVTLVAADRKKIVLNNNARVAYTPAGKLKVDQKESNEALADDTEVIAESESTERYDRIIVPKGRRSMITLADGSKVWVNSDTKVVYPRVFESGKRQIFVEGEVFLKVARDETRPFIVNTSAFEVEVLGTSFNLSARKDNPCADVVLVEGSLDVKDRVDRHVRMQPNDRVELNEEGISKKEQVNALDYIHWVDGVWVLAGKPLKEVMAFLTEYYGQPVRCDSSIADKNFYGKLFLNDSLDKVLKSIRQALPTELAAEGTVYKVEEPEYKYTVE